MATLVTVIHVFVCLFLVLTVLLQPGKGGGMGGAFGGGSTQGVFGGSGGSSMLRKATVFIAAIFMLSSMTLAWLGSNTGADALKQFSAAERAKHERRESLREAVLEGAEGVDVPVIDESDLGEDAPQIEPGAELSPEDLDRILEEATREDDGVSGDDLDGQDETASDASEAAAPQQPAQPRVPAPRETPTSDTPTSDAPTSDAPTSDTAAEEQAPGEADVPAGDDGDDAAD
jgi:preprotein translocase subunit SecG